jgi:O-antigen ligase/tetratricopeptide (TPR) repeat protein
MSSSAASRAQPLNSIVACLNGTMELIVAAILVLSPWFVGGYLPQHLFLTSLGLCAMLLLWTLTQVLTWRLTIYGCWVSFFLVLLFITSGLGIVPMPRATIRSLSPATAQLYDDLLPTTREVSASGPLDEKLPFPPGTTLSLNPGATQDELLGVLALFVLFFVSRHALASRQSLKRLALVLIVNGCLLSIFGMVQKVRSPEDHVYGIHVEGSQVFGPFINRNHFASYVNFSICLGVGLFLASMEKRRQEAISYRPTPKEVSVSSQYRLDPLLELLQHPKAMWLLAPVAVCMTAVATSLSRGGVVSLAIGLAVILFCMRRRAATSYLPLLVILVIAGGLLVWYGAEPTLQRFDQEHFAGEGRFNIWRAAWALGCRFPIFGTGLGTFFITEPLARPAQADQTIVHLHAHNEYLEALAEGGIVRLVITLALIALVLWYGWRAIARSEDYGDQALTAGALGGCVALIVQSIGEFGVHLPSVAAVAAVVAAHLVARGSAVSTPSEEGPRIRSHYFGLGPILSGVLSFSLAVPLFVGLWRLSASEMNRTVALERVRDAQTAPELEGSLRYFDEAIRFAPAHQRLRLERYETQKQLYTVEMVAERSRLETLAVPVILVRFGQALNNLPAPALASLTEMTLAPVMEHSLQAKIMRDQRRQSWPEQQRQILAARDNCPLAWRAQLEIGQYVLPQKAQVPPEERYQYWLQSDSQTLYLNRVKLLHPFRAETWFACGEQEGFNGERTEAIHSWRRCLELSDEYLEPIVRQSTLAPWQPDLQLSTQEIIDKLIPPERPRQLVKAAWLLYPKVTETNQRRPLCETALSRLEDSPQVLEPESQYYYGLALWGVSKREQALQHLLNALRHDPRHYLWRIDLARLQCELNKYDDAREQIGMVLNTDPNNGEAKKLLDELDGLQRPKGNELEDEKERKKREAKERESP